MQRKGKSQDCSLTFIPGRIAEYCFLNRQYGDIFTFILLGQKTTVYLGVQGNEFILNGKLKDVNAEEVYSPLTTPVFGSDVVYDCPNSKLMEQKKFIKYGLTQSALESHVPLIEKEVLDYLRDSPNFQGSSGRMDISAAMAEITILPLLEPSKARKFVPNSRLSSLTSIMTWTRALLPSILCYRGPHCRITRSEMLLMRA